MFSETCSWMLNKRGQMMIKSFYHLNPVDDDLKHNSDEENFLIELLFFCSLSSDLQPSRSAAESVCVCVKPSSSLLCVKCFLLCVCDGASARHTHTHTFAFK